MTRLLSGTVIFSPETRLLIDTYCTYNASRWSLLSPEVLKVNSDRVSLIFLTLTWRSNQPISSWGAIKSHSDAVGLGILKLFSDFQLIIMRQASGLLAGIRPTFQKLHSLDCISIKYVRNISLSETCYSGVLGSCSGRLFSLCIHECTMTGRKPPPVSLWLAQRNMFRCKLAA